MKCYPSSGCLVLCYELHEINLRKKDGKFLSSVVEQIKML